MRRRATLQIFKTNMLACNFGKDWKRFSWKGFWEGWTLNSKLKKTNPNAYPLWYLGWKMKNLRFISSTILVKFSPFLSSIGSHPPCANTTPPWRYQDSNRWTWADYSINWKPRKLYWTLIHIVRKLKARVNIVYKPHSSFPLIARKCLGLLGALDIDTNAILNLLVYCTWVDGGCAFAL